LLKPLVPRWALRLRGRRVDARAFPWAGPRVCQALAHAREVGASRPPRSPSERYDAIARSTILCDYVGMRGQLEASTGVQWLDPLLDDELVEFLASVPPLMLEHDDLNRGLYRLALRGVVPESVRLRPDKADFEQAFGETAEAAGGIASLGDLFDLRALARGGIVDATASRKLFDQIERAPFAIESGLAWTYGWNLLAGEAFMRRYAPAAAA
jgi:asparagine synthase (glutamine-hydrolysing)